MPLTFPYSLETNSGYKALVTETKSGCYHFIIHIPANESAFDWCSNNDVASDTSYTNAQLELISALQKAINDNTFSLEDLERMNREVEAIEERMNQREAQGLSDIYKYFDRLNDKLSSFNNMLVAGYFAIAAFSPTVTKWVLAIPIINMLILIYLDYRMMEQGRFLSEVKSKSIDEINQYGRKQNRGTLWSLVTIITTLAVTVYLLVIVNKVIIPKSL